MALLAKGWDFTTRGAVNDVAVSQKGEYVAAGSEDGAIYFFDRAGIGLWQANVGAPVRRLCMSLDGGFIAATSSDNKVQMYDRSGKPLWALRLGEDITALAITSTGGYLALSSAGGSVFLITREGKVLWSTRCERPVSHISIAADGSCVAAACDDNSVYLFSQAGKPAWNYRTEGRILRVAIAGNGDYILASSLDKRIYLFEKNGALLWSPRNPETAVAIDISSNAKSVAAGVGNEVYFIHRDGMLGRRYQADGKVVDVSVSRNGEYTSACCSSGNFYFFDQNGELLWVQKATSACLSVATSLSGDFVAGGSSDGKIYYFDNNKFFEGYVLQSKQLLDELKAFGANVMEVEMLVQKAEAEFRRKEYASAINYARGVDRVAQRLKERARPEVSVLAVINESFHVNTPNRVNLIVMNTGTANISDVRVEVYGPAVVEGLSKVQGLKVNHFVSETCTVQPTAAGACALKFAVNFWDYDGREYIIDSTINLTVGDSGKKVVYNKAVPVVQIGNVQKLVARVQASKAAVPHHPPAQPAPPHPPAPPVTGPPAAAPQPSAGGVPPIPPGTEGVCPVCGKRVSTTWAACAYCMTRFR